MIDKLPTEHGGFRLHAWTLVQGAGPPLWITIGFRAGEGVTWMWNQESGGFFHGHYFHNQAYMHDAWDDYHKRTKAVYEPMVFVPQSSA